MNSNPNIIPEIMKSKHRWNIIIIITSKWISVLSFSLHVKPIWSIFIPRKYILLIYTVHAKTNKYVKILCK